MAGGPRDRHQDRNNLVIGELHGLGVIAGVDLDTHADLLVACAVRAAQGTRGRVTPEEFLGPGWEGIVQAARSWNPDGGASFRTWAKLRIHGAMRDYMRTLDWCSVSERRRARDEGREVARLIDLTSAAIRLGRNFHEPAARPEPEGAAELATAVMRSLPRLQRRVGWLYWVEGRTLREIGIDVHLTESRCSQILGEARRQLGAAPSHVHNSAQRQQELST